MKNKWRASRACAAIAVAGLTFAWIALVAPLARAQELDQALRAGDFRQAAPRGFGDRDNSWPESMVWWRDHLYVGTSRETVCTSVFALWDAAALNLGLDFADTYIPYPPADPDLSCAPDGADLSLQAEIWRWTPADNTWTRVFQSPLALNNPGPEVGTLPVPPQVMWQGKKLPYDTTFRGLQPFTEPDGTQALYAFGVNSAIMWNGIDLPPPRILRSTDGVTFTPVPQNPGTFLGDLPFASDHSSFRSPVSFAGKLFVLSGAAEGYGALIGSADPAKGNNAWFLASPPGMQFYDIAVFDGWLYLGGFSVTQGYSVMKTRAQGTPPYQLITVVPNGAFLTPLPSESVVSMHVYRGRLYVGTATFTEVIRINPDDSWDLVVGAPRQVPLPNGGSEWKYPLSGLDAGFGDTLNDHAWWMEDFDHDLYIGTYNASTGYRLDPTAGPLLLPHMGAQLYRSHDGGWYYSAVTTTGFATASDPYGGIFDYGIRTMSKTPYGMFLGTTNDYYGLEIFRGTHHAPAVPRPPRHVEIEPLNDGNALLSWQKSPGATQYQIWRAGRYPISIRSNPDIEDYQINVEDVSESTGFNLPDMYIGPYQQVGETTDTVFVDTTVQPGQSYMYYVVAEAQRGSNGSATPTTGSVNIIDPATGAVLGSVYDPPNQSNLVTFPLLTPSVTFAQLLQEVGVLDQRQRFKNPVTQLTGVQKMIVNAQRSAMTCNIPAAISELHPQEAYNEVLEPDATDLAILLAKLVRRLQLFHRFPTEIVSTEFCNAPQQ
ncbi:MAG: hypothetical protein ACREE2_10885 [Stellaceae bacterium]